MPVPVKSTAQNFKEAERIAPVVPKQKNRETQSVASQTQGSTRESRAQEGAVVSEAFQPGTSSKLVAHKLGRQPVGWYVVDADQFCLVRQIALPSKYSIREMINLEVSNTGSSELNLKVKVF